VGPALESSKRCKHTAMAFPRPAISGWLAWSGALVVEAHPFEQKAG
jgi:hypothetical protein